MDNIEKYAMTEEDINIGINDYFTQILIEARRKKNDIKTLDDMKSKEPTIVYVVGQPGSGKTSLMNIIDNEFEAKGEFATEIGGDKVSTFHKYYNELLKLPPNECYLITRQFSNKALPEITQTLIKNGINIKKESCLNKGEKDLKKIKGFKQNGYRVKIAVIAVDKYESFLSCIERDIKLLELGYDPRPVSRMNHDRMYEPLVQEINQLQNEGLVEDIEVYTRGKSINKPQLVYSKEKETIYRNAQEAIIAERAKGRRKLLKNPEEYINRLKKAKDSINLLISDEKMKEMYLSEIKTLESEFYNELACDRNR